MNKHILTTGILLASWAITYRCAAQTYDANAAFQINELSGAETSSIFGPFAVGYLDRLVTNSFTPFDASEHTDAFAGNANTQGFLTINNVIVPAAVVNVSATPFSGFSGLDAGEILLHPGGRGGNGFEPPLFDGVVRFTAPTTAFYHITGAFRSLGDGITDNRIFQNGVSQVSITDAGSFNITLQLNAGDFLDFASGAGPDNIGGDSTGLRATLTISAPLQRVNIDFNGKRPGDADSAGTYVGPGATGGGTVFNGLSADSTGGDDNLTVSGFNLLSDTGTATTVGFTIGPVGGDHEPGQPFEPASLYDDYIFNNSAGNSTPGGSPFTISGLGDALTADIYLYGSFNMSPDFVIAGFAGSGIFGNYNGLNATAYFGVPVTGGEITGLFGVGETGVLGGLTISTTVGTAYWNVDASGLWSIGSNWVGNIAPNAVSAAAAFGGGVGTTITAPRTITVDGAFTVGTLSFNNAANAYTLAAGAGANITLDNGASTAVVVDFAGSHTIQSPLTMTGNGASFNVMGAADTLLVSGAIGGSGAGLMKNGSGTLVLANAANSYTGDTRILMGTLKLAASEVIPDGTGKGGVTIEAAGMLDLGGFHETVNRLSGTGAITSTAPAGKLTVGDASDSSFSGSITGPLEIEKVGPGNLTLEGTFDFQTLTINGGVTTVNSALGNGTTTVNANATTRFITSQTFVALNIGAGATVTFSAPTVINIDFNGQRDGESSPGTYTGLGAAGTGTFFNGILVDSNDPAPNNDNIAVSASGLFDDGGGLTTVTFGIANVGGDTTGGDPLNNDYVFNNSAGNSSPGGSIITIGGLEGTTADIYLFLLAGSAGTTLGGLSGTSLGTVNGISGVFLYDDVPISGGTVNGIFSAGGTGVLTGLTIVTNDFGDVAPAPAATAAVPEPGAMSLLLGGFAALLGVRRRAACAVLGK